MLKIILLMTVSYSWNAERHRVSGFKAPDDSGRQLWGWTPMMPDVGIVLCAACCSDAPSVSLMILVTAEGPTKIFLPGLLKMYLFFLSLCKTILYILYITRRFKNRRAMKNHLVKNDFVTQLGGSLFLSPSFSCSLRIPGHSNVVSVSKDSLEDAL